MSVILSCGHREDNFSKHYNIMTKDWSRDGNKAVGYRTVCLSCYRNFRKDSLILYTDSDALNWLKE